MLISESSKRVVPFRPSDAKAVGEGCYFLDQIVWLNGDRIELGEKVGFNFGCYVNGYGGLIVGDRTVFGPYTMIHTVNHRMDDVDRPIVEQGWEEGGPPVRVGTDCWIGMGVCILPGVEIGEGCVVGAGAVVTGNLDPYTVAVGNPAKPVRSRR